MSTSEDSETREPVEKVLAEFDARKDMLETFCIKTKGLIADCLDDAKLRYQSIQARVKRREKLRDKYQDPKKNYTRLDDITDQAALRIITYYEDEVDRVARVVKKEFTVIPDMSVDKRETAPDRFGYYALNFVCTHAEKRKGDVQFKKYADIRFEIQVTSILRHAWSEIEHEWYDLKDGYPDAIRRRFSRQAALLEIAESEFLSLRDLKVQAEASDLPVEDISLKMLISQEAIVERMDKAIASILGFQLLASPGPTLDRTLRAATLAGLTSLHTLRKSLGQYEQGVLEYVERCREYWRPRPGAQLRGGICIFHLAMMLLATEGEGKLHEAMEKIGVARATPGRITGQVAVARQVVARYKV